MPVPENKAFVYLAGGVATAPDFMAEAGVVLHRRLEAAGLKVRTELLLPYGDWHQSLSRQLLDMRRDLWPVSPQRYLRSTGGHRMAQAIQATYSGGKLLIVGHSGGGVAGVHAAALLAEQSVIQPSDIRIVQIGSPKCALPPATQSGVLYLRAVNGKGRASDPVTRLGSWGGWEPTRGAVPRWNPRLYAPPTVYDLPIVGGHADYFRHREPYIGEDGRTNLEATLQPVLDWFV
jgi:hypothetical protein